MRSQGERYQESVSSIMVYDAFLRIYATFNTFYRFSEAGKIHSIIFNFKGL